MTKFFLLDLILFLIIGGVAIILQYHFGNRLNKKFEIVYGCISAGIIAVISIVFTIKMNPIITPSLHADYLKLNEEIKYTSIELCENYRDCTLKIVANGFRWGYQTYYSGDANVEIYNSKNERLNYYYKAKIYCNLDVNDFIVLKDVNESKIYIFNFDTNQQTQDFYDLLCKKVDKVGVHILSESAHHYKASNPFGQSQVIHYSEPPNPRRESLQILK
ncbi:MAG: hypothetical protein EGR32_02710 [Solobacterium sp.]|nr:hypothetical protein [Solobacterium sp.]